MGNKASKNIKEEQYLIHKSSPVKIININKIPYLILKELSETILLIQNLKNKNSSSSFILKIVNINDTVDLIEFNNHFDFLNDNTTIMKILSYEKQIDNSWKVLFATQEYPFNLLSYCQSLKNPQQLHFVLRKAVKALQDIHSNNILHGNIKPSNILLGYDIPIKLKFSETGMIFFENYENIQINEYLHPDLKEILNHPYIYQDFQLRKRYKKEWDFYALGVSFVAALLKLINSPLAIPNKELLIQFFSLIKKRVGIELIYNICDLLDIREETQYYMDNGTYLKVRHQKIKLIPENFMILDELFQEDSVNEKDSKPHYINPEKLDNILEVQNTDKYQNVADLEISYSSDDIIIRPLIIQTQEDIILNKASRDYIALDDSKDLELSNLLMNLSNHIGDLNVHENSKFYDTLSINSMILNKSDSPRKENVAISEEVKIEKIKAENSQLELSPICMVSPKVVFCPLHISQLLKKKISPRIDKRNLKCKNDKEVKAICYVQFL